MNAQIERFWQRFLASDACPPGVRADELPPSGPFGDNPELANRLGRLVYDGVKTATCSALWEWEYDGDPLPKVGDLEVVVDGQNKPLCITEVRSVEIKPFNKVDADFAYAEGEDERTLAAWRREHWRYFSRVLPRIRRIPEETMPLVCVRFRVLYKE